MTAKHDWRNTAPNIIYRSYPDSDLLPIEPPRADETIGEFAIRAEAAGDTLFLFLCREANDDIDVEEFLHRLDRAINDIERVRDGFADQFINPVHNSPTSA